MNKSALRNLTLYSHILMGVTSIHHVYGAFVYHTPWRLHVLFVSLPVVLLTAFLQHLLLKRESAAADPPTRLAGILLFGLYWSIILVASIGLGVFEGVYNHLLKNVLFYAGANQDFLLQLFPPPTYELPNDFFFELIGVVQAFLVVPLVRSFVRLTRSMRQERRTSLP